MNCFLIASLVSQPLFARISDQVGRRGPYISATLIFTLSNALSATAGDWNWLLLTRGLCGIGVGGMLGLGKYLSPDMVWHVADFRDATVGSITLTDAVGLQRRPYYQSLGYIVYGTGSGSVNGGRMSRTRIDGC